MVARDNYRRKLAGQPVEYCKFKLQPWMFGVLDGIEANREQAGYFVGKVMGPSRLLLRDWAKAKNRVLGWECVGYFRLLCAVVADQYGGVDVL